MNNELTDRQQAIKLRLAGRSVEDICRILGRTPAWFHIWWRRYRALGPNGLLELTRANVQPRRIAPDLERSILTIRQRLASQTHPGTRYSLIGASTILAELQALHIGPLPSLRTLERVLERNGVTAPRVHLAPYLSNSTYPVPQADDSNQLHQVDGVGPIRFASRASGNGTTSSLARTSTMAPFACESTVPARWRSSSASWAS